MDSPAQVAVVMGSKSDWETMRHAVERLQEFDIPVTKKIVSAHRTPDLLASFAREAEASGIRVIIARAGCAAPLPGMIAANTILPALRVPVRSQALNGIDSLLSIVRMTAGIAGLMLA